MLDALIVDLLDEPVAVHAEVDADVAVCDLVDLNGGVDADVDLDVFDPAAVAL